MDDNKNIIELRNVVKYYNNKVLATKALYDINLTIEKGEFIIILGQSGSGKTTLLNIISGMDNATYGDVIVAGQNIIDYNAKQLTLFRRKNIGYVFQQYGLLPNLTVIENIQIGQNLQKNKNKRIAISEILESIAISSQKNKYPNELSGGQQQRVSIARSIAKNPNILFGDEKFKTSPYSDKIVAADISPNPGIVNIFGLSSLIIVEICLSIGSIFSLKWFIVETYVEISKSELSS